MTTTQSKQGIELKKIAEQGDKLDDVAGGFMKIVKEDGIDTVEKFDPWLAIGYEDNGWNNVVGRPAPGSTLTPAPRAVKQYASAIRAALKLGLVIADYDKMRNLVDAVTAKRKDLTSPPTKLPDPELKGVLIRSTGHMNGALWHDAIVVIENLNEEDKDDFEQRLRKLVMRFQSKVPKEVRKPKAA